jgi:DNA-binding IclR family transcriptional regulator
VQRAVRLIRHVAEGNPVLNMSETAKALKINRTTLLRLLHTLEAEGFVERRPNGAGFQVGLSLLEVGARALFSQDLVQVAVPVLTELAEALQLSSHLGVLDGTDVLYLVRRTPNTPLASNIRVGSRLPAHATTMGRMLLAFLPPVEVERLYAGKELQRFSEHTSTTLAALRATRKGREGSLGGDRLERGAFRARDRLGGRAGVRFCRSAGRRHQCLGARRRFRAGGTPRSHRHAPAHGRHGDFPPSRLGRRRSCQARRQGRPDRRGRLIGRWWRVSLKSVAG